MTLGVLKGGLSSERENEFILPFFDLSVYWRQGASDLFCHPVMCRQKLYEKLKVLCAHILWRGGFASPLTQGIGSLQEKHE